MLHATLKVFPVGAMALGLIVTLAVAYGSMNMSHAGLKIDEATHMTAIESVSANANTGACTGCHQNNVSALHAPGTHDAQQSGTYSLSLKEGKTLLAFINAQ